MTCARCSAAAAPGGYLCTTCLNTFEANQRREKVSERPPPSSSERVHTTEPEEPYKETAKCAQCGAKVEGARLCPICAEFAEAAPNTRNADSAASAGDREGNIDQVNQENAATEPELHPIVDKALGFGMSAAGKVFEGVVRAYPILWIFLAPLALYGVYVDYQERKKEQRSEGLQGDNASVDAHAAQRETS